jgi:hypothetical protein
MNAKLVLSTALFLGSLGGALAVGFPAHAAPTACASGYQPDKRGDCQPINGYMDSRCPGYFVPGPSPYALGYRCDPLAESYF